MAKLHAADRARLPKSSFGEPGKRKYPMPDWKHAANAKSRASAQYNRGAMSKSEYSKIVAKADRKMARGK